jgi:hypothetical protein
VPQTGRDGDDWQDVRPSRGKARRQDVYGQDRQQGSKRHGGSTGNGLRQSRSRVITGSRMGMDGRSISRVSNGSGTGKGNLRGRSATRKPHRSVVVEREAAVTTEKPHEIRGARDDIVADSSIKRFVTFYFTNFPSQLSNFYLRKGFEVCGMLEEVVVPSKRNVYGEVYGFVRFSKVRDVSKLLKVVNAVWFGNFKVNARVARFDRAAVEVGGRDGEVDRGGVEKVSDNKLVREKQGNVEGKQKAEGEKERFWRV